MNHRRSSAYARRQGPPQIWEVSSRNRAKNISPFSLTTYIISPKTVASLTLYLRRRPPGASCAPACRTHCPFARLASPLRSISVTRCLHALNSACAPYPDGSENFCGWLEAFSTGFNTKAERMRPKFCVKCVLSCCAFSSHYIPEIDLRFRT